MTDEDLWRMTHATHSGENDALYKGKSLLESVVKSTLLAAWSFTGSCLRCSGPISARGMAEAGAHFDYRLVCENCGAEHTLEVRGDEHAR